MRAAMVDYRVIFGCFSQRNMLNVFRAFMNISNAFFSFNNIDANEFFCITLFVLQVLRVIVE